MYYLFAALLAMGVTVMLIAPLTTLAPRLGVIDIPGGRKAHAAPVPRIGGIAMAAGMLLALLLLGEFSRPMGGLLLGLVVLLPFGIQDDRVTLRPTTKLVGQITAAMCVVWLGDVQIGSLRHMDTVTLPTWVAWPLTLAFIVGVTNAINLADGLDGLAGGTTLLCLSGLLVLALSVNAMQVVFVSVVTMAALVGFLRFNTHPAHIFMGDTGSQILGFTAATVSLMLTQDPAQPLSPAVPLLLLGVPVIDTLTVMIERMLNGRSPFEADRTHVHHRLLAFGFAHHEAVITIYAVQAIMMVLAWLLRFASDLLIVSVFMLMACLIVVSLRLGRARGWLWRKPEDQRRPWITHVIHRLHDHDVVLPVTIIAKYVLGVTMIGYVFLVVAKGTRASWDLCALSMAMAVLLVIGLWLRWSSVAAGWIERAALYISMVLAVTLDSGYQNHDNMVIRLEMILFVMILIALLILHYFHAARRTLLSPLDVLMVILALILPNLPGASVNPYFTTTTLLKSLLLMYGIESLMQSSTPDVPRRIFTGGTLVFLAAVVLRDVG